MLKIFCLKQVKDFLDTKTKTDFVWLEMISSERCEQ